MNAFAHFPNRLHWNAQQLADAVPLRLHELFAFDARLAPVTAAANRDQRGARRDHGYLARPSLYARFAVR